MRKIVSNMPLAILLLLGGGLLMTGNSYGQTKTESSGAVSITIEGTSNLHDWNMKSNLGSYHGVFEMSPTGTLTGVPSLSFSVPAKSLKSDSKSMDKNTYKALNADKHASISFVAQSADIRPAGTGFIINTRGRLTISGVTKDIVLHVNATVNADKSITYTGAYKLKMTDYKVDPPTALFGAISTGDAVTVKFSLLQKANNTYANK
jgi:hypothetical protein